MSESQEGKIVQIRMPKALWEKFQYSCNRNHTNPSEVVRQFARTYSTLAEAELRDKLDEGYPLKGDPSAIAQTQFNIEQESSKKIIREVS
tara:strand:- start:452 stop:721 length:270 start_codon:yes stop_codon:yes gene_type:complete